MKKNLILRLNTQKIGLLVLLFLFVTSVTLSHAQRSKAFTKNELWMMKNADSVKLFRLATMSTVEVYPMVMPERLVIEDIPDRDLYGISDDPENSESFYHLDDAMDYINESSRLMTTEETNNLLGFLSRSGEKFSIPQFNCIFAPGAGIKFYMGDERFYVLLCFNCNIWAFDRREAMYYVTFNDKSRKQLVAYAKALFPDDLEFQLLDE